MSAAVLDAIIMTSDDYRMRSRRRLSTALVVLASTLLLAACGTEQAADLSQLAKAPTVPGFTFEKASEPVANSGATESTGYGYLFSRGDDILLVQYEGSTDSSGSDWNIDSAVKVIEDTTEGSAVPTDPIELAPEPGSNTAWRVMIGEPFSYAQAWERQQCVALVITTLPAADAAEVLKAVDQHMIDACGE